MALQANPLRGKGFAFMRGLPCFARELLRNLLLRNHLRCSAAARQACLCFARQVFASQKPSAYSPSGYWPSARRPLALAFSLKGGFRFAHPPLNPPQRGIASPFGSPCFFFYAVRPVCWITNPQQGGFESKIRLYPCNHSPLHSSPSQA